MLTVDRSFGFLDPRTKLLLLVTLPTFLLGGAGGEYLKPFCMGFSVLPFVLLFISRNYLPAVSGFLVFMLMQFAEMIIPRDAGGFVHNVFLILYEVLCLLLPCGIMAAFIMRTTTVGEFIAAMEKLKVPQFITIPFSVMFRFFPTIMEEYRSIGRAMKMRGITPGKVGIAGFIEYRIVPVMMSVVIIANELSAAALTKGLGGKIKRTCIHRLGFGFADFLLIALCVTALLLFVLSLFDVRLW